MNAIECILGPCVDAFIKNPTGTAVIALFGTIAIFSFILIIKKDSVRSRLRWSYPLIFSILFLLSYFVVTMNCHENMPICNELTFLYSVPVALIGSILFNYILLPRLYFKMNKTFRSNELSAKLPTNVPVYIADNGKPFAFSYSGLGKWIVISQGMLEILSKNEVDAVLLHEYGHLTNNSSFYKSSNFVYSKILFLHTFLDALALEDEEERAADEFATKSQGTIRYINSAKTKLKKYFSLTISPHEV